MRRKFKAFPVTAVISCGPAVGVACDLTFPPSPPALGVALAELMQLSDMLIACPPVSTNPPRKTVQDGNADNSRPGPQIPQLPRQHPMT